MRRTLKCIAVLICIGIVFTGCGNEKSVKEAITTVGTQNSSSAASTTAKGTATKKNTEYTKENNTELSTAESTTASEADKNTKPDNVQEETKVTAATQEMQNTVETTKEINDSVHIEQTSEVEKSTEHAYSAASCTSPQVCALCGETKGSPLGHTSGHADCTLDYRCERCGVLLEKATGHSYVSSQNGNIITYTCVNCGDAYTETVKAAISEADVYAAIIANKAQYPEGMEWTNNNKYDFRGARITGYGCAGFAFLLSDSAFGDLPAKKITTLGTLRVGDIVRVNNQFGGHSFVVLEVRNDGIIIAEGNYAGTIHWGRFVSNEEINNTFAYYMTRYPE